MDTFSSQWFSVHLLLSLYQADQLKTELDKVAQRTDGNVDPHWGQSDIRYLYKKPFGDGYSL